MGSNSTVKKRGIAHYLHKQWTKTAQGANEHRKQVEKEKEKRK